MAQLYDQFGREITPERRPDGRTLAVASIRDRWSTYPSKGLTPEKLGTIFREADGGDVYRQMELFEEMEEKDGHLSSILQTRKLAVTGLDFEVVPFSEEKRDRAVADFVSDVIFNLSDFEDNLLDMLDAVGKGYSALELHWDLRGGKNVVRHMEWIHPKKFAWDDTVAPRLLTEEEPARGIEIPPFKLVFHRHKARSGHPTRQGILRVCAWMYLFKNYDIKDWVAFAEVFGMPLRLGKYDASATQEDKDALILAVRSLGSDAAGIISKSTEIEFVEAVKNSGEAVYEALALFCNGEMSKAVLGHSAGADSTPGKLGGENQAGEVRDDLRRADSEAASKTIRRDLIRPLVGFNFGWDTPLPWFRLHYEPQDDLDEEAGRYRVLIDSGMEIGEDHMYEKFGIPKPGKGEKTVRPPQTQAFQMKARTHHPCPACLVNKEQAAADGGDTVDAMTGRLMKDADFDPMMEPVARLVMEAESLEDLRDRLIDAYSHMDPASLGNLMQRAFAAAELAGRFEAKEGA